MKNHYLFCALAALSLSVKTYAAPTVLLNESFSNLDAWKDLSKAITWAGAPADNSAFAITDGAVHPNSESLAAGMWGATGIRSFSAIDHQFDQAINHATNTITIDFRMRFDEINLTGERNRVAIMLLHDYPEGGLDLTRDAKVSDFSEDWFARPAYQVRIRGGTNPSDAAPYMIYGGGTAQEGEFEQEKQDGTPLYWLPGFVSGPGGESPGTRTEDNYPESGWLMGDTVAASTSFYRYRYILEPNSQSLWVDTDDDGEGYVKILEMPLPFEEDAPTDPAPPLYKYFEQIEGIRIYFRGPGVGSATTAAYIDQLSVTVDGDYAVEQPVTIAMNNNNADYLLTSEDDSSLVTYRFVGTIKNYPSSLETIGLRYTGGGVINSSANLVLGNGGDSPVAGATGAGTTVRFRGRMDADGFGSFGRLVLLDGARWIVEPEADMNFILDGSLFTRQLWVYGDGTGTLEFAEGFVADTTQNGTVGDGIASVRLSNTTYVSHSTESLPVAPRPDGSGGLQVNGHFVFENEGGSRWIVRSNPQTYTGAVWIGVNTTFETETDLTHAGVTQFSSHNGAYWAANAFQTTEENVTITKEGTANLVFAEETAFLPGTVLDILEGGVIFQKNPADGFLKATPETNAGANLRLIVRSGSDAIVDSSLVEMDSLELAGGNLVLEAQSNGKFPLVTLTGDANLNGSVILRNSGNYNLNITDESLVTATGTLNSGALSVVDETGSGFNLTAGGGELAFNSLLPRDPKFFYYQSDGRMVYLGMGDPYTPGTEVPLTEWSLDSPAPVEMYSDFEATGTWSTDYSGGKATWEEATGSGAHGRFVVGRFEPGLSEEDFGNVSFTFSNGATGNVPVFVIRRGVVINEDWSDGAFDADGWDLVNDPDIGFLNTGRTSPPKALARYLDYFLWPVAYYHTDHFAAGPEDVLILKMTSFSDVAFNSAEFAKPEVAALHHNPDHEFTHNHAAEISRHYYSVNASNQVRPSVDNQEISLSSMHHTGGSTQATLEESDTTLGIFRTQNNGTQVETYGKIQATEVVIMNKFLKEDDFIQISIPNRYDAGRNPIHRAGTNASNAVVGVSYAHVGVTSKTDVNLDYVTDVYDFIYLNSFFGQNGTRLQSGDINNDGSTDEDDLALLIAELGRQHNLGGRVEGLAAITMADLPGVGNAPTVGYNAATGELVLIPNGTSISAISLMSDSDAKTQNSSLIWSGDWTVVNTSDAIQWIDRSRLGVTRPVVLATFDAGLSLDSFTDVSIGYADGGSDVVTVVATTQSASGAIVPSLEPVGAAFQLTYGTQVGFLYQVQSSSSLLNPSWSAMGSAVPGNNDVQSIAIPEPADSMFYRIQVQAE